jgi:hypothetical protein
VRAERLYRQGDISIREIARRAGVSEGAVRKRAKAQGWKRKDAVAVRALVRTPVQATRLTAVATQTSLADTSGTGESAECDLFCPEDESEAPEWLRLYLARASSEELKPSDAVPEQPPADTASDAASIRLIAHIDPSFRDAFRIFTDADGLPDRDIHSRGDAWLRRLNGRPNWPNGTHGPITQHQRKATLGTQQVRGRSAAGQSCSLRASPASGPFDLRRAPTPRKPHFTGIL